MLDPPHQELLLTLPLSAFDDDRVGWALVRADMYHLRGQQGLTRAYADTAQVEAAAQLRDVPDDPSLHVALGLALGYQGRRRRRSPRGRHGLELVPAGRNEAIRAGLTYQLVRIYLHLGETEQALDQLEALLGMPYYITPAWLRIDPAFTPLKGNPRFEKLVAGTT